MAWAFPLGLLAALFVLAYFKPQATLRAIRDGFSVPIGLLGDLAEGLGRFLAQAREFWRESFGETFGVRALLGGLLKLGFAALFTIAEFELLRLSMEVLLRLVVEARPLPLFGEETVAGLAAYTGVGLTLMLADGILELSGEAEFLRWRLTPKARKVGVALCITGLIAVCAIQAVAGVLRVMEMREAEQQETTTEEDLLAGAPFTQLAPSRSPAARTWAGVWNSLPLWIQAGFGFLVPMVAGLLGAVALHPVILGLAGLAMALPIGVVILLAGIVRLLLNLVARFAAFSESVLALAVPPGAGGSVEGQALGSRQLVVAPAGLPRPGPEVTVDNQGPTSGPRPQTVATSGDPHQSIGGAGAGRWSGAGSERGEGSQARGNPEDPADDLEALAEALTPNPLNVPEDLLAEHREVDGGNKP